MDILSELFTTFSVSHCPWRNDRDSGFKSKTGTYFSMTRNKGPGAFSVNT